MKLSVITVNLNDSTGLRKTIESVISQSFTDYEYIVIDGGSTDGSVEVIRNFKRKINHWVSEKDKGIYDAMNKGISVAKGDYLLMLNSGDYLASEQILETVFREVENREVDIFYGDIIMDENGKFTHRSFPDTLTFRFFRRNSLSHQATFIKRELHERIGMYNDKLKIAGDWEFFVLAICKFNVRYLHLPVTITVYAMNGFSSDPRNYDALVLEMEGLNNKHLPAFWPDYELAEEIERRLNYLEQTRFYKVVLYLSKIKKKLKRIK